MPPGPVFLFLISTVVVGVLHHMTGNREGSPVLFEADLVYPPVYLTGYPEAELCCQKAAPACLLLGISCPMALLFEVGICRGPSKCYVDDSGRHLGFSLLVSRMLPVCALLYLITVLIRQQETPSLAKPLKPYCDTYHP